MKRSNKFFKDKTLRKRVKEVDAERDLLRKEHKNFKKREGYNVQFTLSKKIKKSPIGEYLQEVLYLVVDQQSINTLNDFKPEFKKITKKEYLKLSSGQKHCFVKHKSSLDDIMDVPTFANISETYYSLDPRLEKEIIPLFYKSYIPVWRYSYGPLETKARRDNLFDKAKKVMGWRHSRYDDDYDNRGASIRDNDIRRHTTEEIKELM